MRILVFGAGVAGLSAAHELARHGHEVEVFEALGEAGGFFRSARMPEHGNMPSEYSWHGFGPWYHNAFELMSQIPYDEQGSVYVRALSRPIDFGIFPDHSPARFYSGWRSIPRMFGMNQLDFARWSYLMLKAWTADLRSQQRYARQNASQRWSKLLSASALQNWRASFGPWIGSDWTLVSLHTAGEFFRKQLMTRPRHFHPPDSEGPAWSHGAGDGWLLLRGPSNEVWFEPWLDYLASLGVKFHWNCPLQSLDVDGARLESGEVVAGDRYVLAINPFTLKQVVERSPYLQPDRELQKLAGLTQHGHHCQVGFRLAFSQPIQFPQERTAVVLADSEFNLTLFAQEQAWRTEIDLGREVESLWTGTACITTRAGRVYGKPLADCTQAELEREILTQILGCQALEALIQEANQGRRLRDFPLLRLEIWHEWEFCPLRSGPPKWVNTTRNQRYLPNQRTSLANVQLAGAHTRTAADVWSIEGAVESGGRAAQLIEPQVQVRGQYRPAWLKSLRKLDNLCYRAGLPHFLDLAVLGSLVYLSNRLRQWFKAVPRPAVHPKAP
ncbi:FAD-dependent oxidoreductase [bacterium]|nr:FAD-dependent oxidoreductase [bacterium]